MSITEHKHILDYGLKENKGIKDTTELWFSRFDICAWEKHCQRTRGNNCKQA